MNIIIAAINHYPWFFDCVTAARARSGCNVFVVSTEKNIVKDAIHCPLNALGRVPSKITEWNILPQMRWLMANWAIKKIGLTGYHYCPDWDIMILHNVVPHIESMTGFGMLYTMDNGHCPSAAHAVKTTELMDRYIEFMLKSAETATEIWQLSDMYTWHLFCRENQIPIANLSEEYSGGVFDHNIHTGGDTWETDEEGRKRIEWHDLKPYFVRRHDSKRIKAEAIHCWQTYKHKTGELLMHAGLS